MHVRRSASQQLDRPPATASGFELEVHTKVEAPDAAGPLMDADKATA
jgi:hypothetical protein